eukprot:CAMPEP_0185157684 /NCGR_PEP_ID=MMETSP1139-20130426/1931_1 /TAXON_ID=298111 /ORGANISM="Pavlova sp., Strain CCMP459" /LENGTH=137 /DNA_ID=CAMNT_0027722781 /DNA_START=197 /DNA_END=611 /DNA_ORIENTATION=-
MTQLAAVSRDPTSEDRASDHQPPGTEVESEGCARTQEAGARAQGQGQGARPGPGRKASAACKCNQNEIFNDYILPCNVVSDDRVAFAVRPTSRPEADAHTDELRLRSGPFAAMAACPGPRPASGEPPSVPTRRPAAP